MFHGTYDRAARADRYRAVAAEYNRLFKTTKDPYLATASVGAREIRSLYHGRAKPSSATQCRLAQKTHQ
jgi:hypothetical protein